MPLEFALFDNPLTPDPTDYRAVVQNRQKRTIDELVDRIAIPGSILKRTECVAVIHEFLGNIAKDLEEGIGFSSDYLTIAPNVGGVFTSEDDHFDPARHEKTLNIRAGKIFKEALTKLQVKKVEGSQVIPRLKSLEDFESDEKNTIITPKGTAIVSGERLKIEDTEADDQGVFFINMSDASEYKARKIKVNEPKNLTLLLPSNMPQGEYSVEVRTPVNGSKNIRTGVLPTRVKVA